MKIRALNESNFAKMFAIISVTNEIKYSASKFKMILAATRREEEGNQNMFASISTSSKKMSVSRKISFGDFCWFSIHLT